MNENERKLVRKLTALIVVIVLLVCGLCVTTYALVDSIVTIQNNKFSMSMGVALKVNDGNPILGVNDVLFEPGATYTSEFPISNLGSFDIWYRVYFTGVEGALKDYITVTVKEIREDGELVLGKAMMSEFTADKVLTSDISAGKEKNISIEFYFSPDLEVQGGLVSFDITVDATQKPNNPFMDFGD